MPRLLKHSSGYPAKEELATLEPPRKGTPVEDFHIAHTTPARLTDLGPLPEVRECNRETTWALFQALQAGESYQETQPINSLDIETRADAPRGPDPEVQDVLNEARRNNRVSPTDVHWARLRELLKGATGFEPPACAAAGQSVPRLVRRMLLRDQIEWAADHGYLALTFRFLKALPEEQWLHMGR
jgi:hypothetical protein